GNGVVVSAGEGIGTQAGDEIKIQPGHAEHVEMQLADIHSIHVVRAGLETAEVVVVNHVLTNRLAFEGFTLQQLYADLAMQKANIADAFRQLEFYHMVHIVLDHFSDLLAVLCAEYELR